MTTRQGRICVGIGGWNFPPWRGVFYPKGLVQAKELAYAGEHLTAIEINATYYGSQKPESFRKWASQVPDGFVFSVKASRFATNRSVLREAGDSIKRFVNSGIAELGDRLGPLLWQFAPFTKFDPDDFTAFLKLLPHERDGTRLRHVIEARHASFEDPRYVALLRNHGVAHCMVDSDKHPVIEDVTADFVYARLERSAEDEPAGYPKKSMARWTKRFQVWAGGGEPDDATRLVNEPAPKAKARDCFVYFISGAKVRNPAAAMAMLETIGK